MPESTDDLEMRLAVAMREFAETDEALKELYGQLKSVESMSTTFENAFDAAQEASKRISSSAEFALHMSTQSSVQFDKLTALINSIDELRLQVSSAEINSFGEKLDDLAVKVEEIKVQQIETSIKLDDLKTSAKDASNSFWKLKSDLDKQNDYQVEVNDLMMQMVKNSSNLAIFAPLAFITSVIVLILNIQ